MNSVEIILSKVRKETDTVLLFSSLTGKDSILLTHYVATMFPRVISVYMYLAKGLKFIQDYQDYFANRYPNIEFIHVPHFSISSHIREGYYGMKQNKKIKIIQLADIIAQMRRKTGVEWVVLGMKQSDGIKRMFELREFEDNAINNMTHRVYPLSALNDAQVNKLISLHKLPKAIRYNDDHSQCVEFNSPDFMLWLYNNHPKDLKIILDQYPMAQAVLFEAINKQK